MAVVAEIAKVYTRSPDETERLGRAFGRALVAGDLVNLQGQLGAGKTLFVKGIAASIGFDPAEVQSPTFTLVHEYRGEKLTLYHLDLYRLDNPAGEIDALGFEEYLDPQDAIAAVEWGERAPQALPSRRFDVVFDVTDHGRVITFWAQRMEPERVETMRRLLLASAGTTGDLAKGPALDEADRRRST